MKVRRQCRLLERDMKIFNVFFSPPIDWNFFLFIIYSKVFRNFGGNIRLICWFPYQLVYWDIIFFIWIGLISIVFDFTLFQNVVFIIWVKAWLTLQTHCHQQVQSPTPGLSCNLYFPYVVLHSVSHTNEWLVNAAFFAFFYIAKINIYIYSICWIMLPL